ncbi:MAG TPA: HD domain-containing protein [Gaiellales bacterium]
MAPVEDAWLVGGSVRDLLMGREVIDVDLVVERDPAAAARSLARGHGGAPFPLSERHGAWRVVRDGHTVDITQSQGAVADDLGRRDFTINAMALPLEGGELLDPHGGRADLEARRVRAVSEQVFSDDPLRLLRLARLAHELGFEVDPDSERLARRDAHLADRPSGERVLTEIRRLLTPDHPDSGIRLLDRIGVLDVVLPEASAMRGVQQSPFHHLDVFEHTLQVLDAAADIGAYPQHYLREAAAPVRAVLDAEVGNGFDGRIALRLAVLFHDIEKPATRVAGQDGGVSFMGHDRRGADTAEAVLTRWRASHALIRFCRVLVSEHLRLGFLVRERPFDRRTAHRYATATAPYALESIVLSLADRLATRGVRARQSYLRMHAEAAVELIGLVTMLAAEVREPLLRGDDIAALTGATGPRIGELVALLAEEQAAGAVTTREEAEALVRR